MEEEGGAVNVPIETVDESTAPITLTISAVKESTQLPEEKVSQI
jgi:hypothetical protein